MKKQLEELFEDVTKTVLDGRQRNRVFLRIVADSWGMDRRCDAYQLAGITGLSTDYIKDILRNPYKYPITSDFSEYAEKQTTHQKALLSVWRTNFKPYCSELATIDRLTVELRAQNKQIHELKRMLYKLTTGLDENLEKEK